MLEQDLVSLASKNCFKLSRGIGNPTLRSEISKIEKMLDTCSREPGSSTISLLGNYRLPTGLVLLSPEENAFSLTGIDWSKVYFYDLAQILVHSNNHHAVKTIEFYRFTVNSNDFEGRNGFQSFSELLDNFLICCQNVNRIVFKNCVFESQVDPESIVDLSNKHPAVEFFF
ncbi:MAG: hypothetical protein AB7F64_03935 [Gammaproteobacteria bacterium]